MSYLTIELKGPIPRDLRPLIGNRIYGCDDCLAACPWNKFAVAGRGVKLAARAENEAPRLLDLVSLDDAAFRARFPKSPIKRVGRDRFIRNVLIAMGNSGDAGFAEAAGFPAGRPPRPWCGARRCGRSRGCCPWRISRPSPAATRHWRKTPR